MKIALFVNSAKTFFWHRKSLADELVSQGHEVFVVCANDGETDRFLETPFKTVFLNMSRNGINPFKEIFVILQLIRIFLNIKPDLCHNFTIKCVIYGSLAQTFVGTKRIINSITGLGIIFVRGGGLQAFIVKLYQIVFSLSQAEIIFQNRDDQHLFLKKKIVSEKRCHLILGSGVNIDIFKPKDIEWFPPRIVFASRLLKSKGVIDLLEVSKQLMEEEIFHELLIAGELDKMNPDSLSEDDLEVFEGISHIKFLGNIRNISELLNTCHIACFPSYYREGIPKFLTESASSGLAVVTTDAPGCREVVNGNGFLIPVKDRWALQQALKELLVNPELTYSFGSKSRQLAEKKFSETIILNQILSLYTL